MTDRIYTLAIRTDKIERVQLDTIVTAVCQALDGVLVDECGEGEYDFTLTGQNAKAVE
jgi:coenzyme F420-reducing hydrogenase delta subunit